MALDDYVRCLTLSCVDAGVNSGSEKKFTVK